MYLLSTPSSAGSLRRPLPPHGLAATEPGLLRLPPPPSPAAADLPETPRPAREQEGEEPAEVARLLLRLLLLLPPPLSAPWAALSMVRARPGRGGPPRWRPGRWGSWRGGGYSSGSPGGAWLLQIPGKRLTHTGGRGGGGEERWEGSQRGWMQLRPPLPRRGPGPSLRTSFPGKFGAGGLICLPARRAAQARGSGRSRSRSAGWARPESTPCRPLSMGRCERESPRVTPHPRTHLGTWREERPHPLGPPGYGPARPDTGHTQLLYVFRTEPGPHTRTRSPGHRPRWPSRGTGLGGPPGSPACLGGEGRRRQVNSPGAFSPTGVVRNAQWTPGLGFEWGKSARIPASASFN